MSDENGDASGEDGPAPAWDGSTEPWAIVLVALPEQEGLRLTSNMVNCDPADVKIGQRVRAHTMDAFDFLKQARSERRHWDVVIVDPPAFVKRKKDLKEGALAYRRINEMAMQVLARDGLLVTCSCSHHLSRAALLEGVQLGARHVDRFVQSLAQLQQGADHPVHPAIPETDYLKGYVCRVLPA